MDSRLATIINSQHKARCRHVEKLDELLAIATGPKNVTLESLRWGYPRDEEADLLRTEAALSRALKRARRMAAALEVELDGVHSVTESIVDTDQGQVQLRFDYSSMKRRQYNADLGVEVRHCKEISHSLTVHFRVTKRSA